MSFTIYTMAASARAIPIGTPEEIAGHVQENAVDLNPLTHWGLTTGSGSQLGSFDFGKAMSIDGVALWIRDYATNYYSGTAFTELYYSSNGSTWVPWDFGTNWPNQALGPFRVIWDPGTPVSYRYIRIGVWNLATSIYMTHVIFFRKFTINTGALMPVEVGRQFYDVKRQTPGGHIITDQYRPGAHVSYKRKFRMLVSSGDVATWRLIFDACGGRRIPFVINEGTDDDDAKMMSFDRDDIPTVNESEGVDQNSIVLVEEPFLRSV